MGEMHSQSSGGFRRAEGTPLIDSITRLPYYRVMEDQAYTVTGKAMNEIIAELEKLWRVRDALAKLKADGD